MNRKVLTSGHGISTDAQPIWHPLTDLRYGVELRVFTQPEDRIALLSGDAKP
jgi:hypothetical protein